MRRKHAEKGSAETAQRVQVQQSGETGNECLYYFQIEIFKVLRPELCHTSLKPLQIYLHYSLRSSPRLAQFCLAILFKASYLKVVLYCASCILFQYTPRPARFQPSRPKKNAEFAVGDGVLDVPRIRTQTLGLTPVGDGVLDVPLAFPLRGRCPSAYTGADEVSPVPAPAFVRLRRGGACPSRGLRTTPDICTIPQGTASSTSRGYAPTSRLRTIP